MLSEIKKHVHIKVHQHFPILRDYASRKPSIMKTTAFSLDFDRSDIHFIKTWQRHSTNVCLPFWEVECFLWDVYFCLVWVQIKRRYLLRWLISLYFSFNILCNISALYITYANILSFSARGKCQYQKNMISIYIVDVMSHI